MILYPTDEAISCESIDFEKLYKKGYRGIIFDIDNTLVPHGAPADKKAIEFFKYLKKTGFKTCLISNNSKERVLPFAKAVGAKAVWKANKPAGRNYLLACRQMKTDRTNTVFVGDQIFTDVLGANLAGIPSILVEPIHPKEEIQIVLKRYLEKIVLFFYHRKKKGGIL
ncbi:MAG: YqeG family HAD IIIA-type phosphatase [Lachnospiraceae bacterium]|nr:YqeG family HAD IIIA-type phosphatase [Lachnospiraceae bacterium]